MDVTQTCQGPYVSTCKRPSHLFSDSLNTALTCDNVLYRFSFQLLTYLYLLH